MSDYIPTTEEVRMAYEIDPENPFFSSAAECTGDEFDRWLEEYTRKKQAQAWEEGFGAADKGQLVSQSFLDNWRKPPNPYRQGEN